IHEPLVLEQELSGPRHRLRFRRNFGADVEADAMAGRGAVLADRHLAEPRLVSGHVLGQQLRKQLHMVAAHAHPAINAYEPMILGRPLAEIEDEPERVAVDEHRIGVNDLARTVLNLDTDRKLAHSSTTNTWPSLTTSVSLTRISRTVPARGAVTEISIFIDSRMRRTSSSATLSPGFAVIFQTLPTSSALTSVTRAPLPYPLGRELVLAQARGRAALVPRLPRRPHDPGRGQVAPPSRPAPRCFSPFGSPRCKSCPPGRRVHCRPS